MTHDSKFYLVKKYSPLDLCYLSKYSYQYLGHHVFCKQTKLPVVFLRMFAKIKEFCDEEFLPPNSQCLPLIHSLFSCFTVTLSRKSLTMCNAQKSCSEKLSVHQTSKYFVGVDAIFFPQTENTILVF